MEFWEMDVIGGVLLEGGTELRAITWIDDHSRVCAVAKLIHGATARRVCEALGPCRATGVSEQMLTDNRKVLAGRLRPISQPS